MMMPPNPGTRRIPRAAKREAAHRPTYAAPVAMGCSIVSRPTSQTYKIPKQDAGKSVDYPRCALLGRRKGPYEAKAAGRNRVIGAGKSVRLVQAG